MDKEKFDIIVNKYPEKVQGMANNLRSLIFKIFPNAVEVAWVDQKVVGYGVGPKKMTEHFCYMVFAKGHINFGFNHGVSLKDAHALLGGEGKKYRNIKIKSLDDIQNPHLTNLIREAIAERKAVLNT